MATRARPTASAEARPPGGLLGTIVAALGGMGFIVLSLYLLNSGLARKFVGG
jgi:hypothetical protein